MAAATRAVAARRDARICALISGVQRLPIGVPAKLTTASAPVIAASHAPGALPWNVSRGYGRRARAAATSRVRTRTVWPCDASFAVRRLPMRPVAPVMATVIGCARCCCWDGCCCCCGCWLAPSGDAAAAAACAAMAILRRPARRPALLRAAAVVTVVAERERTGVGAATPLPQLRQRQHDAGSGRHCWAGEGAAPPLLQKSAAAAGATDTRRRTATRCRSGALAAGDGMLLLLLPIIAIRCCIIVRLSLCCLTTEG